MNPIRHYSPDSQAATQTAIGFIASPEFHRPSLQGLLSQEYHDRPSGIIAEPPTTGSCFARIFCRSCLGCDPSFPDDLSLLGGSLGVPDPLSAFRGQRVNVFASPDMTGKQFSRYLSRCTDRPKTIIRAERQIPAVDISWFP